MEQGKKKLFCVGMKTEIKPLLEKVKILDAAPCGIGQWFLCQNNGKDFYILRTGIGRKNASVALTQFLENHRIFHIINLGLCGSLKSKMKVNAVFAIFEAITETVSFTCRIDLLKIKKFTWEAARIVTTEKPITNRAEKRKLLQNSEADLVDMECAAIAEIAHRNKIPFSAIKIVSDSADERVVSQFKNNVLNASKRLARIALKLLEN